MDHTGHTMILDLKLPKSSLLGVGYESVTKIQRIISYGLLFSGGLLVLLEVIARSSFEEPIAWLVAAGCFCSAAILSGLTAWLSFYMTTNAAYRLLQLINMGICFTSLPGTIYCALLLIQIIRETDTKISLPSWTNVETADERALQSLRVLATVVYFFQVILMGFQAFVGCCMLTRFPYLWSTPTWKRDSLTSSWHINCRRPVSNQLPLLMK